MSRATYCTICPLKALPWLAWSNSADHRRIAEAIDRQ
jgi:P2-related tail formation protein